MQFFVHGIDETFSQQLQVGRQVAGRNSKTTIRLYNPSVSLIHAEVILEENSINLRPRSKLNQRNLRQRQKSAQNLHISRPRTPFRQRPHKNRHPTCPHHHPRNQNPKTPSAKLDAGRQTRLPAPSRLPRRLSLRPIRPRAVPTLHLTSRTNRQKAQTLLRRLLRKLPPPQKQNRRKSQRGNPPQKILKKLDRFFDAKR